VVVVVVVVVVILVVVVVVVVVVILVVLVFQSPKESLQTEAMATIETRETNIMTSEME